MAASQKFQIMSAGWIYEHHELGNLIDGRRDPAQLADDDEWHVMPLYEVNTEPRDPGECSSQPAHFHTREGTGRRLCGIVEAQEWKGAE